MDISAFDFALPEHLIALRPASPRRASRLAVSRDNTLHDSSCEHLCQWLEPGDLLVLNDTRVLAAHLCGLRTRTGGENEANDPAQAVQIEITLARRLDSQCWQCLAKPARRMRQGDQITFGPTLTAHVVDKDSQSGFVCLRFNLAGEALDRAIAATGQPPLPPYIRSRRAADAQDITDYQSIFARRDGAIAAPTASLHFDQPLLARLQAHGVSCVSVTLHVGVGTFLPVKVAQIDQHTMHAEWGEISPDAARKIEATRAAGGRIIAVGTTALRLLETAALETGYVRPWHGETDIFITPGFVFRATDGLMTNFHLPRSTLCMLVAGFIGLDAMHRLYKHAIAHSYRFYSYGDASLLLRGQG